MQGTTSQALYGVSSSIFAGGALAAKGVRILIVLGIVTTGCSKKEPRPQAYPGQVHGTILLDGQPLPSGSLTFIPEASEEMGGRPGLARIEVGGVYWVGNANPTKPKGLNPGNYTVTVLAMKPDPLGSSAPIATLAVPEMYTDYRFTPLKCTVAAGANQVDFQLHSEVGQKNGAGLK